MKVRRINNFDVNENPITVMGMMFIYPNDELMSVDSDNYVKFGKSDRRRSENWGFTQKENDTLVRTCFFENEDSEMSWTDGAPIPGIETGAKDTYFPQYLSTRLFKGLKEGDYVEVVTPNGDILRIRISQELLNPRKGHVGISTNRPFEELINR